MSVSDRFCALCIEARIQGGATGAIAPPKMNPGCTFLGPYPGGCNRVQQVQVRN
jgi:hypothetical protein